MRVGRVMSGVMVAAALAAAVTGCELDPVRSTLDRPADPVVVRGTDVARLRGAAPGRVVAFRASSDGWTAIPVQVDERLTTTMAGVYNLPANSFGQASIGIPVNVYADPTTFVGADPDPAVDADDEIVFMARDAGGSTVDAGLAPPAGTVAGSGIEVRLTEPGHADQAGMVYLFRSDGSLDPSAGRSYVSYTFGLQSGDYRTTYRRTGGPNPENSTVTGASYTAHFSERWLMDGVTLTLGDRPGVDLVDRMKYRLIPGECGRSEDTFDTGEGAFVVNKVGPVRALRGYVGANSGPNTQATHAFYDVRMDTTIDLRVHAIPGVAAYLDLTQAATGMTFRSPQAPGGVAVDGQPDTIAAGEPTWWTTSGTQGGVATGVTIDTDLTVARQARYEDDATPATMQCTGDGQAIGEAGAIFGALACTDPGLAATGTADCTHRFRSTTSTIAAPAGAGPDVLARWAQQARTPLVQGTATFL